MGPFQEELRITSGSKDAVLLVEKALRDRGLLAASLVDGRFGTATIAACARWQDELGYTGLDKSGVPGKTSRAKLGAGRFTLERIVSPGSKVTYRGRPLNTRTLACSRKRTGVAE